MLPEVGETDREGSPQESAGVPVGSVVNSGHQNITLKLLFEKLSPSFSNIH